MDINQSELNDVMFIQICFSDWSLIHKPKGNAQFTKKTIFGVWRKTMAQLRKIFRKIPMNTHGAISITLFCWFVYAEALFDFERWLEKTQENICDGLSSCLQFYLKASSPQTLSCEFRKTFKNNYFAKHLLSDIFFTLNTFDIIRFYHILAV